MNSKAPRIDRLEPNSIINGNFDFWQRGTSFTAVTNGDYTADRMRAIVNNSGVLDINRSTDVPSSDSSYSLELDVTTADATVDASDFSGLDYKIEGYDFQKFFGKTFTVFFKIKSNKTGTAGISAANGVADRSYVDSFTINQADTWEYKAIAITHDGVGTWDFLSGTGMAIRWSFMAGSTFTTGATGWQAGNFLGPAGQDNWMDDTNNYVRISQVMILPGDHSDIDNITFRRAGRNIAEEYASVMRYYQTGNAAQTADNSLGNNHITTHTFAVEMRATPTFSLTPANATNVSSVGNTGLTNKGLQMNMAPSGAGLTRHYNSPWTADAEL